MIETRDALETKIAALAAVRRTDDDLAADRRRPRGDGKDIESGGRGVDGDELFHAAVTAAAHSSLLAGDDGRDQRPHPRDPHRVARPARSTADSLVAHRRIADAIRDGDAAGAATAMHDHVEMVSDVALLRD